MAEVRARLFLVVANPPPCSKPSAPILVEARNSYRKRRGVMMDSMPWPDRIVVDPEILTGKPVIRGTRVAVELVLELLAASQSEQEILANYPGLTKEDLLACLSYASYLAHEYKIYPIPA